MAKNLALLVVLAILSISTAPIVQGNLQESKDLYQWLLKVQYANQKVTPLHFYFHDTLSGKNPTAVRVAQASMTDKSPTLFGLVNMIDDPLTEGPEPTSKLVGRAQGFYGSSGQQGLSLLMAMNLVFVSGQFNGSTLTVMGKNAALEYLREMPIIGGTGVFRFARGFATAKTHYFNATTGDAIVEYNVMVMHY